MINNIGIRISVKNILDDVERERGKVSALSGATVSILVCVAIIGVVACSNKHALYTLAGLFCILFVLFLVWCFTPSRVFPVTEDLSLLQRVKFYRAISTIQKQYEEYVKTGKSADVHNALLLSAAECRELRAVYKGLRVVDFIDGEAYVKVLLKAEDGKLVFYNEETGTTMSIGIKVSDRATKLSKVDIVVRLKGIAVEDDADKYDVAAVKYMV